MFNDKILKSVAEAVKQVLTTEKLHPNQQKLDVHEPEKNKLTSKDFEMLRKGKKADVKEANNPFDVKNYKSQLPTKPGEKAGFDSKKISTGTVYTRKPVKDEKPVKEGVVQQDYVKEIEKAKKKAQGEGNPDLAKGAVSAVKQESVEQIDELSKDTLKSYSSKAKKDSEEYKKAGYSYDSDPDERAFAPSAFKKAASRAAGAAKADSKIKEEVEQMDEGSGPKEKQKTPYRDINSPEYRAAAEKQKQKMKDAAAAEPGKKMLSKMNKEEVEQIEEDRYDDMLDAMMKANGKRLMAKNAKEVQRHRDINSGKALNQLVKKNPDVLKTHTKNVKRTKKLYGEEVEQIEERSMTEPEMKNREKIVKSMKKGMQGFKDRYGDRAKDVMYATATKQAMKD